MGFVAFVDEKFIPLLQGFARFHPGREEFEGAFGEFRHENETGLLQFPDTSNKFPDMRIKFPVPRFREIARNRLTTCGNSKRTGAHSLLIREISL